MKIISLMSVVFLCASFGYSTTDANAVLNLVKTKKTDFCKRGTFSKTVRSSDGIHCNHDLGAAIAWAVCLDYDGGKDDKFFGSQCWKNANTKLLEYGKGSAVSAFKTNTEKSFTIIRSAKQEDVCNFIGNFIPSLVSKCKNII